jgi:hypothetical protein
VSQAIPLAKQATPENVRRFQEAMKAWLRVFGRLHEVSYMYGYGTITCARCKGIGTYGDAESLYHVQHTEDCPVARAEEGLETLRKMATGVE